MNTMTLPPPPFDTLGDKMKNSSKQQHSSKQQQKPINSFFKKKGKEENRTPSKSLLKTIAQNAAADKENEVTINIPPLSSFVMGCKSQDRKGSIQKAKERTFSIQQALRQAKKNGQRIKPKNAVQRKLDGTVAAPCYDDPDNPLECTACTKKAQYEARGKTFKGFAHHYSCPHNKDYFDNLMTGPKSESTKEFEAEAKRIAKVNNQPLPGPDLHVTKEDEGKSALREFIKFKKAYL